MNVRTSVLRNFALIALSSLAFSACDDKVIQPPEQRDVEVTVTPGAATLQVGQTATPFVAVVRNADNRNVTWSSSNPAVATVNAQTGAVTAVAPGTASIFARSVEDNTAVAAGTLTVVGGPAIGIQVVPSAPPPMLPGQQLQLVTIVNGTTNTAVTYQSLSPNIATVSNTGLVTAVAPGTAVIRVASQADPNVFTTVVINVQEQAVTVTIVPTSATLAPGQTRQFTASSTAANDTITWTSSNNNIATVNAQGVVTAVSAGTTQIIARSRRNPNSFAVAEVTVTAASVAISEIRAPDSLSVFPGAVRGTVITQVNVSVPAGTADSLAIRFRNVATGQTYTVTCQRFTAAGAATNVACPVNTIAQALPNATYEVSAVLFRNNVEGPSATFSQQITTANVNTAGITVTFDNGTDPAFGVDPIGRTWNGGNVIVTVRPAIFSGTAPATMSIGYDRECDGTAESVRTGTFNSATGTFTAVFAEGSTVGAPNQGVANESQLGACALIIDPRTNTGAAVTGLNNLRSQPFNLDNRSPAFPGGAVELPADFVANRFVNSGFTFRTSGTGSFQNAGAFDTQDAGACPVTGNFAPTDECVNRVNVQIFAGLASDFPTTINQTNLAAFAAGGTNVTGQQTQNVALLQSNVSNSRYRTVLVARDTLGNQIYTAGPTFGVDLTAPTINVTGGGAVNPTNDITVAVTDDFSGPGTARARITGYSVLEVDTDAGTEVRCYNAAGAQVAMPNSGVCPTSDVPLGAGAGTTGVGVVVIPGDENFYVIELVSTDQAGNQSATTVTRNSLRDAEAPTAVITTTTVSGTSVSISGQIRDNIDLDAYDLRFLIPGAVAQGGTDIPDAIPFVTMTDVDSYGLPLTGVASASGSNAVSIRQLDVNADGTGDLVPSNFGFGVFDVAGNTNMAGFAAQSAGFTPAAGNGVANLLAFNLTEDPTILCRTGTSSACGSANTGRTSTTLSAIVTTPVAASTNPFQTVYFYYVSAGADGVYNTGDEYNVLIGSAAGSSATVQTGVSTRTWTVTQTLAASQLPNTGMVPVFAIGVDAQGDAVITEVDLLDVR